MNKKLLEEILLIFSVVLCISIGVSVFMYFAPDRNIRSELPKIFCEKACYNLYYDSYEYNTRCICSSTTFDGSETIKKTKILYSKEAENIAMNKLLKEIIVKN